MKSKKKKRKNVLLLSVLLIIIILIFNIIFALESRETTIIQLSPQTSKQMMGYIIKTKNEKLIVIDGGNAEDAENLINKINENGGQVDFWFITHAHDDHAGAFVEIANKTDIKINNIYISLNDYSWYEKYEPGRIDFTKKLIDTIDSKKNISNVKEPKINEVTKIDNVNAEILQIKNPEITENAGNEQSVIIKFHIGDKSLLILGDIGQEGSLKLLNNQKHKLKSDYVQMSHHGQNGATRKLYEVISPKVCLWPTTSWLWDNDSGEGYGTGTWKTLEVRSWMEELGVNENYVAKDGDIVIKIK